MKEDVLIKQTSDTTGTGDLTLNPPPSGYRAFSDAFTLKPSGFQSDPSFVPYMAKTSDGSEWEFGTCQVADDAGNGALNRSGNGATVFRSSNSDALVSFTGSTEISLITPANVSSLNRGCTLTGATSEALSDGLPINWTAESLDTDNCWTIGDDAFVYIPLWAKEVLVWWDIQYFATASTDRALAVNVDHFGCENNELYFEGMMQNTSNFLTYLTGQCVLRVNGSNISGNPVGDGSRAGFAIDIVNPDALSVSTSSTSRLRMVILG